MAADAEMCMMAADTMEALGVPRGSYVVKVNNRKVLDGVMEAIGLGGEANAGRRLTVLRAIDKLDRLGVEGIRMLLGTGRRDESGDFTKGADLSSESIELLLKLLVGSLSFKYTATDNPEISSRTHQDDHWIDLEGGGKARLDDEHLLVDWEEDLAQTAIGAEAIRELRAIYEITQACGYGSRRIRIDPSVVRGLEYYTGPVYEVELLLDTKDEKGRPVRFGSVGGGGRYDGLVSRFRGEPVPATGFSIGVSRLLAALQLIGRIDSKPAPGPVVVTVFEQDRIADYQRMVQELRNANIRAELYLGSGKFGAQMKYADKRGAPCVVIQGGDEKAKGEIQIKDLALGAELAGMSKDRDEYKQKQAEAQFAVKESELVAGVRRVLDRHKVRWDS
jgi:histidyl-tRNA synthetase